MLATCVAYAFEGMAKEREGQATWSRLTLKTRTCHKLSPVRVPSRQRDPVLEGEVSRLFHLFPHPTEKH
jgi:hypothetical protein